MKLSKLIFVLSLILLLVACGNDQKQKAVPSNSFVTVISIDTPERSKHYLSQDTVGKIDFDTLGPYSYFENYGFTYVDSNLQEQVWVPKYLTTDTLAIPLSRPNLELSFPNPYLMYPQTFLVQKGDTIIFRFEDGIPIASILNRDINDKELNYDRIRLKEIYGDTYSPHHLIISTLYNADDNLNIEENHIQAFVRSQNFLEKEREFIDATLENREAFEYRSAILSSIEMQNKNSPTIRAYLLSNEADGNEEIEKLKNDKFDFSESDSLLSYLHFRRYLSTQAQYDLPLIKVNYFGQAGASFIDHRVQFDSILVDDNFSEAGRLFLLQKSMEGIVAHFPLDDQEAYLSKLESHLGNKAAKSIKQNLGIPDTYSDKLLLLNKEGVQRTYGELISSKADSIIFINFWASWCAPCIRNMPGYNKLKGDFKNEKVAFLEIAIHDQIDRWKTSSENFASEANSYFAKESRFSYQLQSLDIQTIPHYQIYSQGKHVSSPLVAKDFETAKQLLLKENDIIK